MWNEISADKGTYKSQKNITRGEANSNNKTGSLGK